MKLYKGFWIKNHNRLYIANMKKKKAKNSIKVEYVYVEPKNEQEREEQQQRLNSAYDILFNAVLAQRKDHKDERNKS